MLGIQVCVFENLLEQAVAKFNKSSLKNRGSRQGIDGLQEKRITFESVQKKLQKYAKK